MLDLLLDTHVLLWFALGKPELKDNAREIINSAHSLWVNPLTFWEIALLVNRGRFKLYQPTTDWIETTLQQSIIHVVAITPRIAVESVEMPAGLHGDPVDRMLVATARSERLTLITRDAKILDYAQKGHLQALAC